MNITRLPSDSFSFSRWRKCDIFEKFGFKCRTYSILDNANIIKKYAIGFCLGEKLICRQKVDSVAIMFLIDDTFSWCHLRKEEFNSIFKDI